MLSRLVINFLPRSKRLLISWLQSPSPMILEPPKIIRYPPIKFSLTLCSGNHRILLSRMESETSLIAGQSSVWGEEKSKAFLYLNRDLKVWNKRKHKYISGKNLKLFCLFQVSNSQRVITQICTYVFEGSGVQGQSFFSTSMVKAKRIRARSPWWKYW